MPDRARTLELRAGIRACARCDLRSECTEPVVPRGPLEAELLVIGEAPGKTEDREGRPFVGAAGSILNSCLTQAGIEPKDILFANSACCYPSNTHTPERNHIVACRTNLNAVLSAWSPSIIVVAGRVALSSFWWDLRNDLAALHGRPLHYVGERLPADGGGVHRATVWPTYHPASAIPSRSPQLKQTIIEDLKNLVAYHRDGHNEWPTDCWICGKDFYDFDERGLGRCELHSRVQGELFPTASGRL